METELKNGATLCRSARSLKSGKLILYFSSCKEFSSRLNAFVRATSTRTYAEKAQLKQRQPARSKATAATITIKLE
jgi:hypothetical protein